MNSSRVSLNRSMVPYSFLGVFLVAMATLMYEILLTRIFSVTMWYHYSFMAISIAMFGMTVGANCVFLSPRYFVPEKTRYHLYFFSLLFAAATILSFTFYLNIPSIKPERQVLRIFYQFLLTYSIISIPFILSGITLCLALTRFPSQVGRIYAADLIGAATGCILLALVLGPLDGPTSVLFVSFIASLAAWFFSVDLPSRKPCLTATLIGAVILLALTGNAILSSRGEPFLRLVWVKGAREEKPLYEKWNSFSRIQVRGNPDEKVMPESWGLIDGTSSLPDIRRLSLLIDATAQTTLIADDGDPNLLEFLKRDVAAFAYQVRPVTDVLVVGTGGGRDILTALLFGAEHITGVEINQSVLQAVNGHFGDFTGHLDQHPQVEFINDEARSYISRQRNLRGLIQIPLIDTWAATAAGAYVLSENALYTLEAWVSFLEKLQSQGILSVTRWHVQDNPWEICRSITLAQASLRKAGIENPRDHLMVVSGFPRNRKVGLGNIMVSRSPFMPEEIAHAENMARSFGWRIDISPQSASSALFENAALGLPLQSLFPGLPVVLSPPTDDSPFFFNMLRFSHLFDRKSWNEGHVAANREAVVTLVVLLLIVLLLTLLFILLPLWMLNERSSSRGSFPLFLLFASIGAGFMLIEVSQLQRLSVFLGHPTYSLTVVLFSLLISSGLGSALTHRMKNPVSAGIVIFLLLGAVLILCGLMTPILIQMLRSGSTWIRISAASAIMCIMGFLLGMPFPLGMRIALNGSAQAAPWLWGVNGATSVCASILAMVVALGWGISASFWMGVSFYGIAFVAFAWVCSWGKLQLEPSFHHQQDSALETNPIEAVIPVMLVVDEKGLDL